MSKDPGENLSRPDDVQSSLRDRIAEVLLEDWPAPVFSSGKQLAQAQKLADKVIAALGLRQEIVHAWHYSRSVPTATRHVTDWSNDV